jgi:hypothetical protein
VCLSLFKKHLNTTILLNSECVSLSEKNTRKATFSLQNSNVLFGKLGIWKRSRNMSRYNSDPNPFDEEEEVNPFSVIFLPFLVFSFRPLSRSTSSSFLSGLVLLYFDLCEGGLGNSCLFVWIWYGNFSLFKWWKGASTHFVRFIYLFFNFKLCYTLNWVIEHLMFFA